MSAARLVERIVTPRRLTFAGPVYQKLVHLNRPDVSFDTFSQSCCISARKSRSALVRSVKMALAPHLVASIISLRALTVQTVKSCAAEPRIVRSGASAYRDWGCDNSPCQPFAAPCGT